MKLFEPESDLTLNIAYVAGDIITALRSSETPIPLSKLMKSFLKTDLRRTHDLFFDALTFLYLLNIIKSRNYTVELESQKKSMENEIEDITGKKINQISMENQRLDQKIKLIEKGLEQKKFLDSYKDIEKDLIEKTTQISKLLKNYNQIEQKLNQYSNSIISKEIEIDKHKIIELYYSTKKVFGDIISKELDKVIVFRTSLEESRKNFVNKKINELSEKRDDILEKIDIFDSQRAKLLNILEEKKALDEIKNIYVSLSEIKSEKENIMKKSYNSTLKN